MNDKAFWNSEKITSYFASKPADPRIKDFLKDYSAPNGKVRALDLGCGGGRHTELLARNDYDVSAIDVNPEMLETTRVRLKQLNLNADVKIGSIIEIPYNDNEFDIVVTTGVLHQATSVPEYKKALKELSRVLKPGGYVLLNIFTSKAWDNTYMVVDEAGPVVRTTEGLLMTLLSRDAFITMMAAVGLKLYNEQGEDVKQENTGPRAVYRAFYVKAIASPNQSDANE